MRPLAGVCWPRSSSHVRSRRRRDEGWPDIPLVLPLLLLEMLLLMVRRRSRYRHTAQRVTASASPTTDGWRVPALPGCCSAHRSTRARTHAACIAPKSATRPLRSAGRGKRVIFARMAGLLAMPTLLPEGVLSAEGEDAQAVNSS